MQLLQMGTFLHKYTEFKNWLLQSIVISIFFNNYIRDDKIRHQLGNAFEIKTHAIKKEFNKDFMKTICH